MSSKNTLIGANAQMGRMQGFIVAYAGVGLAEQVIGTFSMNLRISVNTASYLT